MEIDHAGVANEQLIVDVVDAGDVVDSVQIPVLVKRLVQADRELSDICSSDIICTDHYDAAIAFANAELFRDYVLSSTRLR